MSKTSSSRFKVLSETDRQIGLRIVHLRRMFQESQLQLANILGMTRSQLSNVESGRVALRSGAAWKICELFMVHPVWLARGPEIRTMPAGEPDMKPYGEIFNERKNEPFLSVFKEMEFDFNLMQTFPGGKLQLTKEGPGFKVFGVSSDTIPTWSQIVEKLKLLTKEPGMKAGLADDLGTTRQNVNKWFRKKNPGMATADLALAALRWIRKREKVP